MPTVVLVTKESVYEKVFSNIEEVKRGAASSSP
jgi:glucosamine 6-phosphate synthetase-like amidotransferase/phosphosugar isomerase protein